HRREQRQCVVVRLNGLVGDAGGAALCECPRQLFAGGEVQVREENEPVPEQGVLGRKRLLDLEQQLRVTPDLVRRAQRRSYGLVRVVGKRAAVSRAALDEDVVTALDELACTGRRERDAVLVRLDFLDDADLHRGEK